MCLAAKEGGVAEEEKREGRVRGGLPPFYLTSLYRPE